MQKKTMKMKRILKSLRPKNQPNSQGETGTGDLTGSGRVTLHEDDMKQDASNDDDTSLFTTNQPTNAGYDYDFGEVPVHEVPPTRGSSASQSANAIAKAAAADHSEHSQQSSSSHRLQLPPTSPSVDRSKFSNGNTISKPIATQPLRAEETRGLVKKFIADIWNRGELDLIPDVCSPSLRFNGNTGFDRVGHDGLARMVATIRDALDEYHCEIHSMVVEDNKCFCRLRFTGRHVGPLLGFSPTGRTVAWMGATEFTVQNHKILKVWELGDSKSLEEQLRRADDQVA